MAYERGGHPHRARAGRAMMSTPSRRAAIGQMAAGSLAACARPRGASVLTFWAMGREGEVAQSLMPAFEHATGIKVEVQQLPWSAAHAKLLTTYAGGGLPDLCQIGNTWLPEFVALGAVERLDARVAVSRTVRAVDNFPGIWRTNILEGGLYGVPWYIDTRLMFYRPDLLARAGYAELPMTWAGWLAAMQAVKRMQGPSRYAALLPLDEYEPLLTLALQHDEPLLRDGGGRGNFQSPGFKAALNFYDQIFRLGLAPVAAASEIGNLYDEFARGFFSFYITGPWNLGEFRRRLPRAAQDLWMTSPMPGPVGPGASMAGGSSLVVFKDSPRKAAAWRLIEYLCAPDVQRRFGDLTGDLPARRDAWTAPPLADDRKAAAFHHQLDRVRSPPQVPEWERIAAETQIVAEQMVRGRLTVDQAAQEIDRRADRLLEKHRWMRARAIGAAR